MLSSILSRLGVGRGVSLDTETPQRTWTEWIGSLFGSSSVQDVTSKASVHSAAQDAQNGALRTGESINLWNNTDGEVAVLPEGFSLPKHPFPEKVTAALDKIQQTYPAASVAAASVAVASLRNLTQQTEELRDLVGILADSDSTGKGLENPQTLAASTCLKNTEDALQVAVVSLEQALKEGKTLSIDEKLFSFGALLEKMKSAVVEAALRAKANRAEFKKLGRMPTSVGKEAFAEAEQVTNKSETELFNVRSEAATICQEISTQLLERLHEFTVSASLPVKDGSIGLGAGGVAPTTPDPLADTDYITRTASSWIGLEGSLKDPSDIEKQAASWLRSKKEDTASIKAGSIRDGARETTFGNSQLHPPEDVTVLHKIDEELKAKHEELKAKYEEVMHTAESELPNLSPSGSAMEGASHDEEATILSTETIEALEQKLLESLSSEETSSESSEQKSGKKILEILSSAEFQVLGFDKKSYVQKIKILFQFLDHAQRLLESARADLRQGSGNQRALFQQGQQALSIYQAGLDALDLVVKERDDFIAHQQQLSSVLSAFKTTTGPEIAVTSGGLSENSVPVVTVAAPLFKVDVKKASTLLADSLARAKTARLAGRVHPVTFSEKLQDLLNETGLTKEQLNIRELAQTADLAQKALQEAETNFQNDKKNGDLLHIRNDAQYAFDETRALQAAFRANSEA